MATYGRLDEDHQHDDHHDHHDHHAPHGGPRSSHDHSGTMWCSVCVLASVLILGIVGISVDTLATQSGTSDAVPYKGRTDYHITADIEYAYSEFRMWVHYPNGENRYRTVDYNNATEETCSVCSNNASSNYYNEDCECSSMKRLRDSGLAYFGLYITGLAFIFIGVVLSLITSFGRLCCHCKCPMQIFIGIIVTVAMIMFLAAGSVLSNQFFPYLTDVISYLIAVYFPLVYATFDDEDNWDDAEAGGSLVVLWICVAVSFGSIILTCCEGNPKRREWANHFHH